ncbi:MAG: hypothetical protein KDA96_18770, partial [Planctomycetaceae bacterium]|nr:hypothetical protein [Planctomycetaceae bacterium]
MPPNSLRTFVALPFPEASLAEIISVMGNLEAAVPGVRLASVTNLHVTLQFLGETDVIRLPSLKAAIQEAAAATD